jgi:hypothetical protein
MPAIVKQVYILADLLMCNYSKVLICLNAFPSWGEGGVHCRIEFPRGRPQSGTRHSRGKTEDRVARGGGHTEEVKYLCKI